MPCTFEDDLVLVVAGYRRSAPLAVETRLRRRGEDGASPVPAERTSLWRALSRITQARVRKQQVLGTNRGLVFAEDQGALDHVLQFANVPRPGLGFQQVQRWRGQFRRRRT